MRERLNVVDCGDLVYAFGDAREMSEKLQAHAEKLLAAGKRMLSFGGDHFVTLPLLRAHAKHFGKMALVHFDAHTDTYANGCEFDHGTMFYTAPNEGLSIRTTPYRSGSAPSSTKTMALRCSTPARLTTAALMT
ncbi:agmatinase [Klebsiella pneumoniae]|uniref:Agmatinase n=1 Tax=Klebsiella pneumoniae TaxID=573 RepID=A0A377XJG5_KLEPN|nr:agmatinase [Klebsiella pneumoniae]